MMENEINVESVNVTESEPIEVEPIVEGNSEETPQAFDIKIVTTSGRGIDFALNLVPSEAEAIASQWADTSTGGDILKISYDNAVMFVPKSKIETITMVKTVKEDD